MTELGQHSAVSAWLLGARLSCEGSWTARGFPTRVPRGAACRWGGSGGGAYSQGSCGGAGSKLWARRRSAAAGGTAAEGGVRASGVAVGAATGTGLPVSPCHVTATSLHLAFGGRSSSVTFLGVGQGCGQGCGGEEVQSCQSARGDVGKRKVELGDGVLRAECACVIELFYGRTRLITLAWVARLTQGVRGSPGEGGQVRRRELASASCKVVSCVLRTRVCSCRPGLDRRGACTRTAVHSPSSVRGTEPPEATAHVARSMHPNCVNVSGACLLCTAVYNVKLSVDFPNYRHRVYRLELRTRDAMVRITKTCEESALA